MIGGEGVICRVARRSVDATWEPPYGERAIIPDRFREATLTLAHERQGALNGTAPRQFSVPLDFLPEHQEFRLELFSDDPTADTATQVRVDASLVTRASTLERAVAARNGFAAILTSVANPR